MNNLEVYEEYIKKVLNIPYCNFHNLDEKIIYEIIVGLSLMYEMYPLFNKIICMVGSSIDSNDYQNIIVNSNIELFKNNKIFNIPIKKYNGASYTTSVLKKNDNNIHIKETSNILNYISLIIGEKTLNTNSSEIYDLPASFCGRYSIYHEFGHILDIFLNLSNDEKINKIASNFDIKKELSSYATTNSREMVAEAFAYYIFSKRKLCKLENKLGINEYSKIYVDESPLILVLGYLIDEKYNDFYNKYKNNKEMFDLNKNFFNQKEYSFIDIKESELNLIKTLKMNRR